MNSVQLMGRITKDLEVITSASGMEVLKFTIAINRRKKGESDFINCVAFKETAVNIAKFFKKGAMIAVEGRIQTGSYDNKEGKKVYTTDIMVAGFHFTGEKKADGDTSGTGQAVISMDDSIDELPF